ncbi:unnamed protein product [Linum tenue]|uniref:BZIP domain-containing protein n=1 Tax=Linum tenue TaxID=586396 RepID=A0AAV0HK52_9ROSI|nr:unnamed protein product [Linum tenue]
MTLEEFLVQAGVVQEAAAKLPPSSATTSPSSSSSTVLHQLKLEAPTLGSFHGTNGNNFSNVTGCFGSYHMMMNPSKAYNVGEASSSEFSRIIDGPPEVLVERRQRRMIKNRESAARSRARK